MPLTRRQFAAGAATVAVSEPRRPNIVFILSDDHRWDMLACAGHPWLRTPHLDALAAGGARFRNAFVTTSLCSPSRATILTGLYAHAHGVVDNFQKLPPNLPTFPKILHETGYRTAFIGKWHMGDPNLERKEPDDSDMPQPGFDHWISFRGQGEYRNPLLNFNGERRRVTGYITDLLTAEALRWLGAQKDQPFCLYLSHKAVHADFEPAERHRAMYSSETAPRPATAEVEAGKPEWLLRKRKVSRHGLANLYAGQYTLDTLYRDYARTLMAVDDSVGAILEQLRSQGVLDNTLVVHMGDNGFLFGEQGLVDKRVMYEPSIRVPLLAHWPAAVRAGTVVDEMAANIDIAPTLATAAGVRAPASMHGRSLLPLLRGQATNWREELLYEYFWDYEAAHTPSILGLRTPQYSFIEYQGIWDVNELYDLRRDPEQATNLLAGTRISTQAGGWFNRIQDPRLRETVRQLRSRMVRILNETGAPELTRGPVR
jgi:arylsulfatase A-like enzyme